MARFADLLWRVGLFEKILRALNFATNKYLLVQIDSTFCKDALVNEYFQLIGVVLTGGQIHDSECAITLLSTVNLVGKTVLADKAFNSEKIRAFIQEQGAAVCVPDKSNAVINFQRIKEFRHIAIRFDKLDICFLNFIFLAHFIRHL